MSATAFSLAAAAVLSGLIGLDQRSHKLGVVASFGILALGLAALEPMVLPMAAIVGTVVVARVGGGSADLSVSDALLFFGTLMAVFLVLVRRDSDPNLRRLLWLVAIYETVTLIAVAYNPYRSDWVEWVHEAFLAGGSLLVGWVVGRAGRTREAMSALLAVACVLAIAALVYSGAHHFHLAYIPGGYQKNFIGDWLDFPIFAALTNPRFIGWRGRGHLYGGVLCIAGLLASGSRQGILGIVVALVVYHLRGHLPRARRWLLRGGIAVALALIGWGLQKELASSNLFNSAHQRVVWYRESLRLFHLSPLLGEGFRWWYTTRFTFSFAPPNGELEILTSVGLVGLFAFLVLHLGALRALWRLPPAFGMFAFAALVMRLVQTLVDQFWLTSQSAIPWMFVGLALGALYSAGRSRPALSPGVHPLALVAAAAEVDSADAPRARTDR